MGLKLPMFEIHVNILLHWISQQTLAPLVLLPPLARTASLPPRSVLPLTPHRRPLACFAGPRHPHAPPLLCAPCALTAPPWPTRPLRPHRARLRSTSAMVGAPPGVGPATRRVPLRLTDPVRPMRRRDGPPPADCEEESCPLEVEEREKNVEPKLLHFYEKCCGMF